MWGDNGRPSSRRERDPGAASSVDGESDAPVPDLSVSSSAAGLPSAAVAVAIDAEEEAAFRRRSARFDEAERSFNALMAALIEHKAALGRVAAAGVAVAERLNEFFCTSSGKEAHRELAGTFLTVQQRSHGQWVGYERRYEKDVLRLVKNRVDEIPGVRTGIKRRANALNEMKKLQRKTNSERNKVDGPFAKVRQKRLKELESVSAEYTMHHSDVMRKFSNIERNFGNFVSPSLIALVSLLTESSQESVKSLAAVQKLITDVKPMTKELSPAPMDNTNGTRNTNSGTACDNGETWDDDFDEPMLGAGAMSPSKAVIGGTNSLNLPSNPESSNSNSGSHTRSRSEPVAGAPQGRIAMAVVNERHGHQHQYRAGHSADTASLPDMAGSEKGARHNGNVNLGSTSSGERDESVGGAGSVGTGIRERLHGSRRSRSRREGMGSSDTVPSESNANSEVLMRVLVLYDFTPREVNEIELRKGDVVEVSEKTDSGWWFGRCRKYPPGFFPRNYTRELTDDEELQFLQAQAKKISRRHGIRNNQQQSNGNGLSRRHSRDSRRSAKSGSAAANASSSHQHLPNDSHSNRSRARAV